LDKKDDLVSLIDINEMPINAKVSFVARVEEVYSGVSKNEKKTKYIRLKVSDETSNLTVLFFNDKIDTNKILNKSKNFEEGNIVIFKGIKRDDCVFGDLGAIQDHDIYMKLSEVKNIKT
jgi:RecG-like helicase